MDADDGARKRRRSSRSSPAPAPAPTPAPAAEDQQQYDAPGLARGGSMEAGSGGDEAKLARQQMLNKAAQQRYRQRRRERESGIQASLSQMAEQNATLHAHVMALEAALASSAAAAAAAAAQQAAAGGRAGGAPPLLPCGGAAPQQQAFLLAAGGGPYLLMPQHAALGLAAGDACGATAALHAHAAAQQAAACQPQGHALAPQLEQQPQQMSDEGSHQTALAMHHAHALQAHHAQHAQQQAAPQPQQQQQQQQQQQWQPDGAAAASSWVAPSSPERATSQGACTSAFAALGAAAAPPPPPLPSLARCAEHAARLAAVAEFASRHRLRELHSGGGALPEPLASELRDLVTAAAASAADASDASRVGAVGAGAGAAAGAAAAGQAGEGGVFDAAGSKQLWLQALADVALSDGQMAELLRLRGELVAALSAVVDGRRRLAERLAAAVASAVGPPAGAPRPPGAPAPAAAAPPPALAQLGYAEGLARATLAARDIASDLEATVLSEAALVRRFTSEVIGSLLEPQQAALLLAADPHGTDVLGFSNALSEIADMVLRMGLGTGDCGAPSAASVTAAAAAAHAALRRSGSAKAAARAAAPLPRPPQPPRLPQRAGAQDAAGCWPGAQWPAGAAPAHACHPGKRAGAACPAPGAHAAAEGLDAAAVSPFMDMDCELSGLDDFMEELLRGAGTGAGAAAAGGNGGGASELFC